MYLPVAWVTVVLGLSRHSEAGFRTLSLRKLFELDLKLPSDFPFSGIFLFTSFLLFFFFTVR